MKAGSNLLMLPKGHPEIERRRVANAGFLCSPEEHRAMAKELRKRDADQKAEDLAVHHDNLAKVIERRLARKALH
jgi:hypothetical protein